MPDPPPQPAGAPDEAALFHKGLALFNGGQWFEAHEVWEDAWHMAEGRKKRFYQGLIQCAVALVHMQRGNPRGVRNVWRTCQSKFKDMPEVYMGIEVPRLLERMRRVIQPILDLPPHRFDPGHPRPQQLPFDPEAMPRIDLVYDPFASSRSALPR